MKKTLTVTTEYAEIIEVKASWSEEESNKLLASGQWTLLHGCVAHQDGMGYQAKPCWLLGRKKK